MSKALDYLLKIRPEAMNSYFDFIKKSTGHLDTKTRALISVITKVDNQTEKGFKQYLNRALQNGVTANEIIDALFAAFPTLGLSKIIWAVDIIIEMDLAEFHVDNLQKTTEWHELSGTEDFKDNIPEVIQAEKKYFIVYKSQDKLRVYSAFCPHQNTLLTTDLCKNNIITCSRHSWEFDIRNGECVKIGYKPLQEFKTKEEDGKLFVSW